MSNLPNPLPPFQPLLAADLPPGQPLKFPLPSRDLEGLYRFAPGIAIAIMRWDHRRDESLPNVPYPFSTPAELLAHRIWVGDPVSSEQVASVMLSLRDTHARYRRLADTVIDPVVADGLVPYLYEIASVFVILHIVVNGIDPTTIDNDVLCGSVSRRDQGVQ